MLLFGAKYKQIREVAVSLRQLSPKRWRNVAEKGALYMQHSPWQLKLLLGAAVILSGIAIFMQPVLAASAIMRPVTTVTNGWAVGNHLSVDETTLSTTDYIGTGTDGSGGEVVTLGLGGQPTTIDTATQLVVNVHMRTVSVGSDADTVVISTSIGGTTVGTSAAITPSTFGSMQTFTYNGSWTQAQIDNVRVTVTRTVNGGGSPAGRDDDIRINQVYADLTYTSTFLVSQASYRWFENSNSTTTDDSFTKLANPATVPAGSAYDSSYSPDGTYLSVAHVTSPYLTIYKRSGDTFTKLSDPAALPTGTGRGVAFSPDGTYLSVVHDSSPYLTIYKRSGDTFTKLSDPTTLPPPGTHSTAFSPDGTYLSVTSIIGPYLTIYKRSGDTFTKLPDPATLPPDESRGTAFSPDGTYLSVTSISSPYLTIYKRSGDTFTKLPDPAALPNNFANDVAFSSDGNYLSVAVDDLVSPLVIYKRSGDTFTKLSDPATLPPSIAEGTTFSPDGLYLSVAHASSPYLTIYKRSGDTFTKLSDPATLPAGTGRDVAFSPSGTYMSVSHVSSPSITIYKTSATADVGSALVSANSPATAPASGFPFRLRLNLAVSSGDLSAGGASYKLKYAPKSGTCSLNPSGYADVTTTSEIQYYDNSAISDGVRYGSSVDDPVRSGVTAVGQNYKESNPFTASAAIPAGQDGLWDFALTTSSSALEGQTYCIIATTNANTALNSYAQIPEVTVPVATQAQGSYRLFENADSLEPGAPLASENTAASTEAQSPFRLRQLVEQLGQKSDTTQNYKLQYAEMSGVCDPSFVGEIYEDIDPPAGANVTNYPQGGQSMMEAADEWSSPLNITSDDGLGATYTIPLAFEEAPTDYLRSTAYNYSVPANATIDGIEVAIETEMGLTFDSPNIRIDRVSLVKDGVRQTTIKSSGNFLNPIGPEISTFGGSTDLWGATWTPADINNANFGADMRLVGNFINSPVDVSVDYMTITVFYSVDGEPGVISYSQNASAADNSPITATVNDPAYPLGATVLQRYSESYRFGYETEVLAGQAGLWDFSLTSSPVADGKTYCFRIVQVDGDLLEEYTHIAEITFVTSAPEVVPTAQRLRNGRSLIDGVKTPFEL